MDKGAESEEAKSTLEHKQTESKKRKKVNHACVYCRRSHMTCDAGRPCSRCVKRNIGHLCYDEARPTKAKRAGSSSPTSSAVKSPEPVSAAMTIPAPVQAPPVQNLPPKTVRMSSSELMKPPTAPAHYVPTPDLQASSVYATQSILPANLDKSFTTDFSMLYDPSLFGVGIQNQPPYAQFASEQATSEFLVLSDFLNIMGSPQQRAASTPVPVPNLALENATGRDDPDSGAASQQQSRANSVTAPNSQNPSKPGSVNGISESAQEKFFLTAADPNPESAEDRLKSVINAKVEAGLMKPFNYVRGYARLQKYMDANMSAESKQRILAPLSTFRPAFRAIAKRLTDVDLILVEEAFERLLLDYDRVFTSISVPACLWRRTGEIFRGNKEFAALLNIPAEHLRDGKLAITELMAEDSAVNYWEKYGNIAFDGAQKAVLTSCLLQLQRGDGVVSCCFSFTIKRDRYNIPSCIVGNFIPVKLS